MGCGPAYDSLIIGGGFFGLYIAEHLTRRGRRVVVCERQAELMGRASYANQARVHNGYHYPRSMLTALRSRVSFPRFVAEFDACIDRSFEKYYMVGRMLSKVTARQYEQFCQRIGARCEPATSRVRRLVNPRLVEEVFSTTEFAFDAVKLRDMMISRLAAAGVEHRLRCTAHRLAPVAEGGLDVTLQMEGHPEETLRVGQVFNCTYAMLNFVLENSGLPRIPLKQELAEIALVEVPPAVSALGITVMSGPFFSVMPFPPRGLHSFSHVRYTPHCEWFEGPDLQYRSAYEVFNRAQKRTSWPAMIRDAQRYIPALSECRYRESLWEVKTVLPRSETDDGRPILFKPDYALPGVHCVMGGKIDNVYDVVDVIDQLGLA